MPTKVSVNSGQITINDGSTFLRDELTQLHQLPYTPYYGTVDTTILWITTLAEA